MTFAERRNRLTTRFSESITVVKLSISVLQKCGVPRNFFRGVGVGVQQIQLRIEGRENGDLGGGGPLVRGSTQFANE
jgi:hypothetical protein